MFVPRVFQVYEPGFTHFIESIIEIFINKNRPAFRLDTSFYNSHPVIFECIVLGLMFLLRNKIF